MYEQGTRKSLSVGVMTVKLIVKELFAYPKYSKYDKGEKLKEIPVVSVCDLVQDTFSPVRINELKGMTMTETKLSD